MKKKVWTFESICRAARRRGTWKLVPDPYFSGFGVEHPTVVVCELGFCPLGAVFTREAGFKRPAMDDLEECGVTGVRDSVADAVMGAADEQDNRNRPRMLKLLGIKS